MSEYDKIWIEVDVGQDRDQKTAKLKEIIDALDKVSCVHNVTKCQYRMPSEDDE